MDTIFIKFIKFIVIAFTLICIDNSSCSAENKIRGNNLLFPKAEIINNLLNEELSSTIIPLAQEKGANPENVAITIVLSKNKYLYSAIPVDYIINIDVRVKPKWTLQEIIEETAKLSQRLNPSFKGSWYVSFIDNIPIFILQENNIEVLKSFNENCNIHLDTYKIELIECNSLILNYIMNEYGLWRVGSPIWLI